MRTAAAADRPGRDGDRRMLPARWRRTHGRRVARMSPRRRRRWRRTSTRSRGCMLAARARCGPIIPRCARRTSASGRPGPGAQVADEVRALACGLAAQGFRRGDAPRDHRRQPPAAVLVDARRAVPGRRPGADVPGRGGRRRWRSCCTTPRSRFAVVEDQEQVDKLLEVDSRRCRRSSTSTTTIRAACATTAGRAASFDEPAGDRAASSRPQRTPASSTPRSPRAAPTTSSVMLYTSGTTGKPKGVCQTHARVHRRGRGGVRLRQARPPTTSILVLPADGLGRRPPVLLRAVRWSPASRINCPESGDTVMTDLREIGPTYYFAPPRVFENLLTQVMIRMEDAERGQAQAVPPLHGRGAPLRRRDPRRQAGRRRATACTTRSASCWSTGRCATCSA
ncbi:MAG: AMP-binding protein [Comamonadaceae bacterium]|nr:AMP-binding protein [Comamonadaceae bacterium]